MIEKQDNTPGILLYMPDPKHLPQAISGIEEELEFIESFRKLLDYDDIDKIIEKMDGHISIIMNQLSEKPTVTHFYKNTQEKMSDEYFFIQRTNIDAPKRFILNAFVIAKDILVNNKIDNYLNNDQIKLSLKVMENLLSYTSSRGELNECE